MKYHLQILLIIAMASLASCGPKRIVITDAAFARELSHSLQMRLTPKDNLLLYAFIDEWMGVPYQYGGNSKRGVDCSNFVRNVELKAYKRMLSRSSEEMYRKDIRKTSKRGLVEGDLVFFATDRRSRRVNHVGIYLKQGYFAHASTSTGVMISSLEEDYYRKAFVSGGRIK